MSNKVLIPGQQIIHMCWVCKKMAATRHWDTWKPQFLALKGQEIYIFDNPPVKARDWSKCETKEKIFECMFRVFKDSNMKDSRAHMFAIQVGGGETHVFSTEGRQDLLRFEKAWYRANYLAVKYVGSKTFGCKWNKSLCGLTLDLQDGFTLYDSKGKSYLWGYRFSQLKGSCDDGKSVIKFNFLNDETLRIDIQEIECTDIQTVLFTMHAFLSAKLASVDPTFLTNL